MPGTNILEIVENYGAIIAADDEIGCFVTWAGGNILNFWIIGDECRNTNIRTSYGDNYQALTFTEAQKLAEDWLANPNDDPACARCGNFYAPGDLTDGVCENCAEGNENA